MKTNNTAELINGPQGCVCWHYKGDDRIISPLAGDYNRQRAAAFTCAVGSWASSCRPLRWASAGKVFGRMERIDLGRGLAIVDLRIPQRAESGIARATGRVIAVLSSAGLRDRQKRRMMAEVSAQLADITILTAEDPRTESLAEILAEMQTAAQGKGAKLGETLFTIGDRGDAIRKGATLARRGDLLIACGKGHEQSMCFDTTEYAWDDRTAMRAALAELLGLVGEKMPYLPTQD